jgi:hypothetical protein
MASLISAGVPSCLALEAWMWAHFTTLDMNLSFHAEKQIIYNSNRYEESPLIKFIFIYLDRLIAVKLFPDLYQKMNQYLGTEPIIN